MVLEMVRAEGFPVAGIARAEDVPGVRERAMEALAAGHLADMSWMDAAWIERATTSERFLAGARSIIVVGLPNHTRAPDVDDGAVRGRVARYAWGRDYHRVFEKRLRRLAKRLREEFGAEARATVDYGPLLERPYAELAGLAWRGKSTMELFPGFGPWVMLGVVATSLELEADVPLRKSCGSCRRCITACPTGAIDADGFAVDSRRCISYQTIENRGVIPRELRGSFGDRVFGCDICLEACPVGQHEFATEPDFEPGAIDDALPGLGALLTLSTEEFAERFRGRAIMRAKRDGMVRNACVALGNVGGPLEFPALVQALGDGSWLVRAHAAWAVGQVGRRNGLVAEAGQALESALAIEQDERVREEVRLALAGVAGGPS